MLYSLFYNTKQPHYDFPMMRITILPQEKPFDMKEGKPGPEGETSEKEVFVDVD